MIKILYILGSRPTGGVGTVVYNYQLNFNRDNINIDYVLFSDEATGEFDEKVKLLGSKVYVFPALQHKRVISLQKKIKKFFSCNASEYSAVHIHSPNVSFLCRHYALKYGIKNYIIHSHSTKYSDSKLKSFRNFILCLPLRKKNNIYFACSKAAAKFLYGKKAVEKDMVYLMRNAIECDLFRYDYLKRNEIRKELGIKDELVIGNVGRFSKEKNHDFMLDIFYELKKKNIKSKLLLVGDGELVENIQKKSKDLNIYEDIIFLGRRNDINRILQSMDVFILTSYFEGFGISLIEAQATGLLTFASDVVPEEVKVTDNIYLLGINQRAESWAEEIIEKSTVYERKNQAEKIKESGFDIKLEANKLEQYYMSLNNERNL